MQINFLLNNILLAMQSKKRQSKPEPQKFMSIRKNSDEQKPNKLIAPIRVKLDQEFLELTKLFLDWNRLSENYSEDTQLEVIKKYCGYYSDYMEEDRFNLTDLPEKIENRKQVLLTAKSESIFFKTAEILEKTAWGIRLGNKFRGYLSSIQDQDIMKNTLSLLIYLAEGHLPGPQYRDSSFRIKTLPHSPSIDYTAFFALRFFENKNLFFNVGVEKIPTLGLTQTITYQYKPYINFIDVIDDGKLASDLKKILSYNYEALNQDFSRGSYIIEELSPIQQENKFEPLFKLRAGIGGKNTTSVILSELASDNIIKYCPPRFRPLESSCRQSTLQYDDSLNQMVTLEQKQRIESIKEKKMQEVTSVETLKSYVDINKKAENLAGFLLSIPNFKIKLNDDEIKVINSPGNIMAVGRSGTGKTTCAVLRLFAIEMKFKIKEIRGKKKANQQKEASEVKANEIEETFGLRSMMVTASSFLTVEIHKFYLKLKEQLKIGLNNRNKKKDHSQQPNKEHQLIKEILEKSNVFSLKDFQENRSILFKDLTDSYYPCFFTVEILMNLLNSTFLHPFFALTNQNQKSIGINSKERKVRTIIHYSKSKPRRKPSKHGNQNSLEYNIDSDDQDSGLLTRKSFEIDYSYFSTHFWSRIKSRYYNQKNINSHVVWTQIYSTIKGSADSYRYENGYLSKQSYVSLCKNTFLSAEQKNEVYDSFLLYENYKTKINAYDFMDVVNYFNLQIQKYGYVGPVLHHMMIDQVQDLPHSLLYLLSRIVKNGLFFGGDTAQTIAKGVGFRFSDLRTLFDEKYFKSQIKLQIPVVHQLSINYRSHNNILQLANSIVLLIECLFPKTIDRLRKQKSDFFGQKPILLLEADLDLLFVVLSGDENAMNVRNNLTGRIKERPKLEFGAQQVILVRDEDSKEKIPTLLQNALCYTVHEAKGLEFNDVILFNFFSDCPCEEKWNLLRNINVFTEQVDKTVYESQITRHDKRRQRDPDDSDSSSQPQNQQNIEQTMQVGEGNNRNKVTIKKIKPSFYLDHNKINQHSQLCSELKLLYTAVTRARNLLIIYDQNPKSRIVVEKYWNDLQVVSTLSAQMIHNSNMSNSSQNKHVFKKLVEQTSPEEWQRQGDINMERKFYDKAEFCYSKSNNSKLTKMARAYNNVNKASILMDQVDGETKDIEDGVFKDLPKAEFQKIKFDLKDKEQKAREKFVSAGILFQDINELQQSARCYYSAKEYKLAVERFERLEGKDREKAQCYFLLGEYEKSLNLYEKIKDYLRQIQCLSFLDKGEEILMRLDRYSESLPKLQKKRLILKYVPQELDKLVEKLDYSSRQYNHEHTSLENLIIKKVIEVSELNNKQIREYFMYDYQKQDYYSYEDYYDIRPKILELIFGVLQRYEMLRLCMFVANKYYLAGSLEKYLILYLVKDSVLAKENTRLSLDLLNKNVDSGILIKNEKLKADLFFKCKNKIRSDFLPVVFKKEHEKQSNLGVYFASSMLLLGFSKCLCSLLERDQKMSFYYNCFKYEEYSEMFFEKYGYQSQFEDGFLKQQQMGMGSLEYTMFTFESFLHNKIKSNKFIEQIHEESHPLLNSKPQNDLKQNSIYKKDFPCYFPFNQALWRYIQSGKQQSKPSQGKIPRQYRQKAPINEILQDGLLTQTRQFLFKIDFILSPESQQYTHLEIFDIVTFGIVLMLSKQLIEIEALLSTIQIITLHSKFQKICEFFTDFKPSFKSKLIYQAILCVFQVKTRSRSNIMKIFGDEFLFVHRDSSIAASVAIGKNEKVFGRNLKYYQTGFLLDVDSEVVVAPLDMVVKAIRNRLLKALVAEYVLCASLLSVKEEQLEKSIYYENYEESEQLHICIMYCVYNAKKLLSLCANKVLSGRFRKFQNNSYERHKAMLFNSKLNITQQIIRNVFYKHEGLPLFLTEFLTTLFSDRYYKKDITKLLYLSGVSRFINTLDSNQNALCGALHAKQNNLIVRYCENFLESIPYLFDFDLRYYFWDVLLNLVIYLKAVNSDDGEFLMYVPEFMIKYIQYLENVEEEKEAGKQKEKEKQSEENQEEEWHTVPKKKHFRSRFKYQYLRFKQKKSSKQILFAISNLLVYIQCTTQIFLLQEKDAIQQVNYVIKKYNQNQINIQQERSTNSSRRDLQVSIEELFNRNDQKFKNINKYKDNRIWYQSVLFLQNPNQYGDYHYIDEYIAAEQYEQNTQEYYEYDTNIEHRQQSSEAEIRSLKDFDSDDSYYKNNNQSDRSHSNYDGDQDQFQQNQYEENIDDQYQQQKKLEEQQEEQYKFQYMSVEPLPNYQYSEEYYQIPKSNDLGFIQYWAKSELVSKKIQTPQQSKDLDDKKISRNYISIFYGVDISKNPYINNVVNGAAEITSYLVTHYMQKYVSHYQNFQFIVEKLLAVREVREDVVEGRGKGSSVYVLQKKIDGMLEEVTRWRGKAEINGRSGKERETINEVAGKEGNMRRKEKDKEKQRQAEAEKIEKNLKRQSYKQKREIKSLYKKK